MASYLFARRGTPSNTGLPQGATAVPNTNRLMRSLTLDGAGMVPDVSNPGTVGAGGSRWFAGPDQSYLYIAYIVGSTNDATGNNLQPVNPGVDVAPDNPQAGVGFWGRPAATTDTAMFLKIGQWFRRVQDGASPPFSTSAEVNTYLASLGAWSNYTGP